VISNSGAYLHVLQTFSPLAAVGKDPTYHCRVFQQTSSVVGLAPHFHECTAGDRPSVWQAGSPPGISHFNLVLSK